MDKYVEKAYLKGLDDASKFLDKYAKEIDNEEEINVLQVIKGYQAGVMAVLNAMEHTYKMLIGDNKDK